MSVHVLCVRVLIVSICSFVACSYVLALLLVLFHACHSASLVHACHSASLVRVCLIVDLCVRVLIVSIYSVVACSCLAAVLVQCFPPSFFSCVSFRRRHTMIEDATGTKLPCHKILHP